MYILIIYKITHNNCQSEISLTKIIIFKIAQNVQKLNYKIL